MATSLQSRRWTPVVSVDTDSSTAKLSVHIRGTSGASCLVALRFKDQQLHARSRRRAMAYFHGAAGGSHRSAARLFSTAVRAFKSPDSHAPRTRPTFARIRKHNAEQNSPPFAEVHNGPNSPRDNLSEDKAPVDPPKVAAVKEGALENASPVQLLGQNINGQAQQGVDIVGDRRPPVAVVLSRMKTILNKTKGKSAETARSRQVHSSSQDMQKQGSLESKTLPQFSAVKFGYPNTLAEESEAESSVLDRKTLDDSQHESLAPSSILAAKSGAESFAADRVSPENSQFQSGAPLEPPREDWQPRMSPPQERTLESKQPRFQAPLKRPSETDQPSFGWATRELPRVPPLRNLPVMATELEAEQRRNRNGSRMATETEAEQIRKQNGSGTETGAERKQNGSRTETEAELKWNPNGSGPEEQKRKQNGSGTGSEASRQKPAEPPTMRRTLPPLKLRTRSLVRKGPESGAEQSESGTSRLNLSGRADSHQDPQRRSSASQGSAFDTQNTGNMLEFPDGVRLADSERGGLSVSERSGLGESARIENNGQSLFEPQLREGHVEAGDPLTEWLRAAAPVEPLIEPEPDLQPLDVPGFAAVTREGENLESELAERLALGDAGSSAEPLMEWSVTVPNAEADSATRAREIAEVAGGKERDWSTGEREFKEEAEIEVTREETEAAPLTEWLTQARGVGAGPRVDNVLVSTPGAKLTEWREQADTGRDSATSSPLPNALNQQLTSSNPPPGIFNPPRDILNPPPKPVPRPRSTVGNAQQFAPKGLDPSSSSGSEVAETADMQVQENVTATTSDSTALLEQRTPEWHALRRWRLTASAFGNAAGCWPDGRLRLWEEKLELRPPFKGNAATAWGTKRESPAIDEYLRITSNSVAHQSFKIYKEHDEVYTWLGASPDGLIERDSAGLAQGSGVLEVKCPFGRGRPETAQPYGSVPFYYIPQVQGLLEIFDREWADVYVWTVNGSVVYRVDRDPAYWALLFSVLSEFWWQHVIPAKHEMLQGRMDPAYLRKFEPQATDVRTGLILEESKRLSAKSPAIWTDSGRVLTGRI